MFDYRGAALRQQQVRQQRGPSAITFTQPAPIGGWNTRDDAGNMPPQDAELLVNWIPEANFLRQRNGSQHYVSLADTSKPPTAILEFKSEGIVRALYCAQGSISVQSGASATVIAQGLVGGDWSGINFNNVMGLFNGADTPLQYDGGTTTSSITELNITGPSNPRNLVDAHIHRGRVYYVEKDVCGFWYGDADTLGATLTFFPLSRVARNGGKLLAIKSWTVDGGEGPDDYAVFIMDSGEVIVYQGNDPGRAATWALVGRYTIPKPIHRRACVQVGSQIVVATETDYMMLPEVFQKTTAPTKLSGALKEAAAKYRTLPGWQGIYYQAGPWLLFNVPTGPASSEQHVINLKGASTKFTGWDTQALGVVDGILYYGGFATASLGMIFRADIGNLDAVDDTNSTAIVTQSWQAPSNLGQSLPKSVVDYRPRLQSEGDLTVESGLAYDFGPSDFNQSVTLSSLGAEWNTSDWDTSEWATENFNKQEWMTGGGDGTYVQLRMTTTAPRQTLKWFKTDYRYRLTGPLE